jgi:hypothetical protein
MIMPVFLFRQGLFAAHQANAKAFITRLGPHYLFSPRQLPQLKRPILSFL